MTATALPSEILRGIDRLDPLPVTAHKLFALASGEEVSLARVAELIEYDQAIAASVLRLARSAVFSGARPADTVREAVMRLGTVALLNIVLGDYLRRLKAAAPPYGLTEDDLWAHAAAAQLAVRAIRVEPRARALPPVAETAALLHDIGKLVMARQLKVTPETIRLHAQARKLTFVDAERDLFGVDHAAVGGAIADRWRFPKEVADAIARHHEHHPAASSVLDAVVVANVVAKSIGTGLGAEGLNFSFDVASAARLGLDFRAVARVCLRTDNWLRELRATAA